MEINLDFKTKSQNYISTMNVSTSSVPTELSRFRGCSKGGKTGIEDNFRSIDSPLNQRGTSNKPVGGGGCAAELSDAARKPV